MDSLFLAPWNVFMSLCVLLAIEGLVWPFLSVRALSGHGISGNTFAGPVPDAHLSPVIMWVPGTP